MGLAEKKELYRRDSIFSDKPWDYWTFTYDDARGLEFACNQANNPKHGNKLLTGYSFTRCNDAPNWKQKQHIVKLFGEKCFNQVAGVTNEVRAVEELYRVAVYPGVKIGRECLGAGFSWGATPQGKRFWQDIYVGKNPYSPKNSEKEMIDEENYNVWDGTGLPPVGIHCIVKNTGNIRIECGQHLIGKKVKVMSTFLNDIGWEFAAVQADDYGCCVLISEMLFPIEEKLTLSDLPKPESEPLKDGEGCWILFDDSFDGEQKWKSSAEYHFIDSLKQGRIFKSKEDKDKVQKNNLCAVKG